MEEPSINQSLKVSRYACRQGAIADEEPKFNVAIEGRLCEVCRGDKDDLIVDDDGLGMKDARGPIDNQRARILVHMRP
jgi:hypothetical protein